MFAEDKHSSFIRKSVNYGQKMFYNIGPCTECHYAVATYLLLCHYAECCYAECHYAECRYAECRGTDNK